MLAKEIAAMSTTGLAAFDRTMHKTHVWLNAIMDDLDTDSETAYAVLRATLHALRDRMPAAAAASLGAQLPMLVRGMYYEGYAPAAARHERSIVSFLTDVRLELGRRRGLDVERAVKSVLKVLAEHVDRGEARHVQMLLPKTLRALWPS
jgi:uncharacterized protein (DUF2267 family)